MDGWMDRSDHRNEVIRQLLLFSYFLILFPFPFPFSLPFRTSHDSPKWPLVIRRRLATFPGHPSRSGGDLHYGPVAPSYLAMSISRWLSRNSLLHLGCIQVFGQSQPASANLSQRIEVTLPKPTTPATSSSRSRRHSQEMLRKIMDSK